VITPYVKYRVTKSNFSITRRRRQEKFWGRDLG